MTSFNVGDEVELIREVDGVPVGTNGTVQNTPVGFGSNLLIMFDDPDQTYYDEFDDEWVHIGNDSPWWVTPEDVKLRFDPPKIIEPSEDIYNDLI